ncbi:MAG: sel1 repeat family protein [Myxococcaceae bacterium]|nr:sel1 repeat family protein [Myxococcaceae bacterium]
MSRGVLGAGFWLVMLGGLGGCVTDRPPVVVVVRDFSSPQASAESRPLPEELVKVEQACSQGEAQACKRMGVAYWLGQGVPKDSRRAAPFLEKGCEAFSALQK